MSEFLDIPGYCRLQLIRPLVGFKKRLEEQLKRFPYDSNIFLMMKFRGSNKLVSDFILSELETHGLQGIRADNPEWNITGNVYNPIAVLYCCRFGLALFDEPEQGQAYSANVAYELGFMHLQDKNCLILKHASLPPVPFDLVKDLYYEYVSDLELRALIAQWIRGIKADAVTSAYDSLPGKHLSGTSEALEPSIPLSESDPALYILKHLALLGEGFYSAEAVAHSSQEPLVKARYFLESLSDLGYVYSSFFALEDKKLYQVKPQGVKTLVEQNVI